MAKDGKGRNGNSGSREGQIVMPIRREGLNTIWEKLEGLNVNFEGQEELCGEGKF